MKKKQIEKIPYMTLPACNPDEEVLYIGRTAWRNIGNERHIILEVYENKRDCMQVPVVRYVATKKDWGGIRYGTRNMEQEKDRFLHLGT